MTVSEVHDEAALRIWERVLAEGYPPAAVIGSARPSSAAAPGSGWLTATASRWPPRSHTAHGVVTVEAVATLPEHRGCGIGAAATWAATTADPDLPAGAPRQ